MLTCSGLLVMTYGIVGFIGSPISDTLLYGLMIFSSILLLQSAVIVTKNRTNKPTTFRMVVESLISTVPITGVIMFIMHIDHSIAGTLTILLVVQLLTTILLWKERGAK